MEDKEILSKRGKSNRRRGHSFERLIAADLRQIWPEARRHLEYQDGEANGVDIANTGETFRIQCKAKNTQPSIPAVMKEVNVTDEQIPVVIFKVDGKGTYAAFRYEDAKLLMSAFGRK